MKKSELYPNSCAIFRDSKNTHEFAILKCIEMRHFVGSKNKKNPVFD